MPTGPDQTLYIRPYQLASEPFLGVRPASEYLFLVIASPAGNYFKSGAPAVSIWVASDYTRAAPGGTGAAKWAPARKGTASASNRVRPLVTAAGLPVAPVRWLHPREFFRLESS